MPAASWARLAEAAQGLGATCGREVSIKLHGNRPSVLGPQSLYVTREARGFTALVPPNLGGIEDSGLGPGWLPRPPSPPARIEYSGTEQYRRFNGAVSSQGGHFDPIVRACESLMGLAPQDSLCG